MGLSPSQTAAMLGVQFPDQIISENDPTDHSEVLRKESAESLIEAKEIGSTLKRMRLKRSLGLVELGERAGLSASYLSQLETGRVVPTIRNLTRLAMALNVDLSVFFRKPRGNSFAISRDSNRVRLPGGVRDMPFMYAQSMSSLIPNRIMVPCIAELLPDTGEQAFESKLYQGLEFAFVMDGCVQITTAQRSETLEPHDVIWLDPSAKRTYRCVGKGVAKVMIVSFPQQT